MARADNGSFGDFQENVGQVLASIQLYTAPFGILMLVVAAVWAAVTYFRGGGGECSGAEPGATCRNPVYIAAACVLLGLAAIGMWFARFVYKLAHSNRAFAQFYATAGEISMLGTAFRAVQ